MYVEDVDGEEIENPVSIKEQAGSTVHFLDMKILQSTPGISQIKMYDERDHMGTLEDYRKYPHKLDCLVVVSMPPSIANYVDLQLDVQKLNFSKMQQQN